MTSGAPPHPGAAWQQCQDQTSGYPYYWNTVTNEVRWDCPLEFQQWSRGPGHVSAHVSLPPPGLVTNISLATPVSDIPKPQIEETSHKTTTSDKAVVNKPTAKSKLVIGYDSEDDEDSQSDCDDKSSDNNDKPSDDNEKQPGFIGPVIPKPDTKPEAEKFKSRTSSEAEKVKSRTPSQEEDDILSLIEAEQPPDYQEHVTLPSATSRESTQPKQALKLVNNYDNSDDESTEEMTKHDKQVTQLDQNGRFVFTKDENNMTEEQKLSLERYKRENIEIENKLKKAENKRVNSRYFCNLCCR